MLKLKQKSLQITPTTIEKTMAPHQLFEANNPLWMTEYTAEEIDNIIYSYEHIGEEYQQEPDCIKLIFDIHKQLMHGYAVHIVEIVRKRLDERNN